MNAAARLGREIDTSRLTRLVGYATTRAALELRKAFTRQMAPLDIKVTEFSILTVVGANPCVNQRQIGQALDISAPNMAVTLDRMAERGWIERVRSTEDRRSQQIHLLPAGRVLVLRAEKIAATMEDGALRRLSSAERALLIELLLKIGSGGTTRRRDDRGEP